MQMDSSQVGDIYNFPDDTTEYESPVQRLYERRFTSFRTSTPNRSWANRSNRSSFRDQSEHLSQHLPEEQPENDRNVTLLLQMVG